MSMLRTTALLLTLVFPSLSALATEYPLPSSKSRLVGENLYYTVPEGKHTLEDIAAQFQLGLSNLLEANPGVDPFLPKPGSKLLIPKQLILPNAPREGIVINVAEMRLYYYPKGKNTVEVLPIGIGQIGKDTPENWVTSVQRKRANPTWTPTPRIRKEYAARGTYIYPPKPSMRIITDIFEYCAKEVPKWNTISVSGYHIREAGATAVQELAFTLADGKAYLQAAIDKKLDINVFAKRISFFFNAHNNLFEEVAKFRAARRMWAKITTDLGATDPRAMMLRFHTQTGGSTLTAQQPMNNIMRVTIQALAAVLGGTQSLHTNGYDEALSLPTEEAATIALRTQQVIAHESGVTQTVDPLGGSYFIESLTDEIEAKAWEYINRIDEMGGAVNAIEAGFIQQEIAHSAYLYQKDIQSGSKIIVGQNKYVVPEPPFTKVFSIDDAIRVVQMEKLKALRASRNNDTVKAAIISLEQAARDGSNLMPHILHAVENYATLGEVCDTMRKVFGEYEG